MRVRFKVNLGSIDAKDIGVDYRQCQLGTECDVPEKAGRWLVSKGIATEELPSVRAIPAAPAIAQSQPASIKSDAKPAPLSGRGKLSNPPDKES